MNIQPQGLVNPRKQEIDARVQAAIENLQAGRSVEDDAGLEFKADWPDPAKKARQLAGAANSLRGGLLVYVVGVDDTDGAITVPQKTEPQEWYAKARKSFDQVAPELLWVQTVFVGDGSNSVQVLVFDTSDFPYVVNAENRREVPIRIGAATESAHRNQLVRMFEPSLRPPNMEATQVRVGVTWEGVPIPIKDSDPPETSHLLSLDVDVYARVFIEHFGSQPTTLPVRDMRARLVCADFETRPDVHVKHLGDSAFPVFISAGEPMPPEPVPPQYGVYALDQHVVATAPGEFTITASTGFRRKRAPDPLMSEMHALFASAPEMRLDLALRVVGVEQVTRLSASLNRSEAAEAAKTTKGPHGEALKQRLGAWELPLHDNDPWA